jgi:hypothetical protein
MNTAAFLMMIFTTSFITGLTIYFFIKVLKAKPKQEPDSYSQNDHIKR